jgi:hypothetical protein
MGFFSEIVRRLGRRDRGADTRYTRSQWDEWASHIVPRRWDGSSFDEPYRGGLLEADANDLWPAHLGNELRDGDYRMGGEMRQERDGSWHRRDQAEPRRNPRAPEQYRPGIDVGYRDAPSGAPNGGTDVE